MRRIAVVVVLGIAVIAVNTSPASAAPLAYVVDFPTGELYTLDLPTGTLTRIGDTFADNVQGLTLACNGTLYGIEAGADELITLNALTAATTAIGSLGVGAEAGGLTFGADGRLWLSNGGALFEVNPASGAATLVGPFGGGAQIAGLATGLDGTVYGFDNVNDHLVTINTASAALTRVGNELTTRQVLSLDFDAQGILWAVSGGPAPADRFSLTFDLTTGASVARAPLNLFQAAGLAIKPICAAVPTTTTTTTTTATTTTTTATTPAPTTTTTPPPSSSAAPQTIPVPAVAANAVSERPTFVG